MPTHPTPDQTARTIHQICTHTALTEYAQGITDGLAPHAALESALAALQTLNVPDTIRQTYIHTAWGAYEQASMDGLCPQGASECALAALQTLNINTLLSHLPQ